MCCIRHANLDAFWGWETSTVYRYRLDLQKQVNLLKLARIDPQLLPLGPFPLRDIQGLGAAAAMLLKSLEPGRYAAYTQFTSMRKLRSAYSNAYLASAHSLAEAVSLGQIQSKMHL
eukprot:10262255-Ditylum_brightwellii.AAC.1